MEEVNKKKLDIIDHMTEHLQSYEGGRYLVLGPTSGGHWGTTSGLYYQGQYLVMNQPQQPPPAHPTQYYQPSHLITPHYYRGYGNGEGGGCLIENMVGNWSPDLTGTYSPFGTSAVPGPVSPIIGVSSPTQSPPVQSNAVPSTIGSGLGIGCQTTEIPVNQGGTIHNQVNNQCETSPSSSPQPSISQMQQQPSKKQRIVAEVKPLRPSYSDVLAKSAQPPKTPPPPPPAKTSNQQQNWPNSNPKAQNQHSSAANSNQSSKKCHSHANQGAKGDKKSNSLGENDPKVILSSLDGVRVQSKFNIPAATLQKKSKRKQGKEERAKKENLKNQNNHMINNHNQSFESNGQQAQINGNHQVYEPGYRRYGDTGIDIDDDDDDEEEEEGEEQEETVRQQRSGGKGRYHQESTPQSVPVNNSTRKQSTTGKVDRSVGSSSGRSGKSKKAQRSSKRKETKLGIMCRKWRENISYYLFLFATWLIDLLIDVTAMSAALVLQIGGIVCRTVVDIAKGGWWKCSRSRSTKPHSVSSSISSPPPLTHNIHLPTTGEEAMKRLLSCKGKDPYSILGLTNSCSDEDIRRYYRSQALLVHPDKNSQPGAEEAFKILVHAFDLIAEPEKRAAYDRYIAETNQVEQAWSELSDLLSQLQEKMHYAATTIRCNVCGKRHKRVLIERPVYAARFCSQCNIHHSAKEGDMWCEWGRFWRRRYLACMEGRIYEVTEWAKCQGGGLADLVPHSHLVHYRVLLGGGHQDNHQQAAPNHQHSCNGDPQFEDLLSSLYNQCGSNVNSNIGTSSGARNRTSTRRKPKK